MTQPTYFSAQLANQPRHVPQEHAAQITIIGGGPSGMALALALARRQIKSRLLDARERGAARNDPRVLALSHGSQLSLQWLGVWHALAAQASPIACIHVSQRGGFGRSLIRADEEQVPALGQVVPLAALAHALDSAMTPEIEAGWIDYRPQTRIAHINRDDQHVWLQSDAGFHGSARLVVYAEGTGGSTGTDGAGPAGSGTQNDIKIRDYGQHGLVTTVRSTSAHQQQAWERFTAHGPVALLPLQEPHSYNLVYSCATRQVEELLALSDRAFIQQLQTEFGERLQFVADFPAPRQAFPLQLRYRPEPVAERCIWLGNAAQTLHPVAGQGFNLGLRDVMTLSQTLAGQQGSNDPGSRQLVQEYLRRRQCDRRALIRITDGLVRLFSNDQALLRRGRGLGLFALDLLPGLRHGLARQLMYGVRG